MLQVAVCEPGVLEPGTCCRQCPARAWSAPTSPCRARSPTWTSRVRPSIHSIWTIGQVRPFSSTASSIHRTSATQSSRPWAAKWRASAPYRTPSEASSRMKKRSARSAPSTRALNTTAALPDAGAGIPQTGCRANTARRSDGVRKACSGSCAAAT